MSLLLSFCAYLSLLLPMRALATSISPDYDMPMGKISKSEAADVSLAYKECQQQLSDANLRMDKTTAGRCRRVAYKFNLDEMFESEVLNPPREVEDEDDDPPSLLVPVKGDADFQFSNFFMDFAAPLRPVMIENLPAIIGAEEKVDKVLECSVTGGVAPGGAESPGEGAEEELKVALAEAVTEEGAAREKLAKLSETKVTDNAESEPEADIDADADVDAVQAAQEALDDASARVNAAKAALAQQRQRLG